MNLYQVENGYVGEANTHVLVVAETEPIAVMMASTQFMEESLKRESEIGEGHGYDDDYWQTEHLTIELLAEDIGKTAWVSRIR